MTNYERYKSDIEPISRMGRKIAIERGTNKICSCLSLKCIYCLFYDHSNEKSCDELAMEWADEYIEPEVDWSKIPVDTQILVSSNNVYWHHRHFAKYENGRIYAWNDGFTSFTIENNNKTTWWSYAKLADV